MPAARPPRHGPETPCRLDCTLAVRSMHDEATPHYIDMIDQTTLGHKLLKDEFNAVPTVGWQLDPFGHSATQAALLSAEAGFDGLFFGRVDYQVRDRVRSPVLSAEC